jgi:hypothetical protein
MSRNVLVTLFKTIVLWHVMQIVPTHNNSPLHLSGNNNTAQNSSSDTYVSSKRAFLVYIFAFDRLFGGLVTKTYVLVVTERLFALADFTEKATRSNCVCGLLLERSFGLRET